MRVITKKISLEPFKSRLNGSTQSFDGEEEGVIFLHYNKYDIRFNNYGMLPFDVIYDDKVLSYPTLIERYYFCKKYVEILCCNSKCGNNDYKDAIDYYNHTSKYQTNSSKQTYENLHNTFIEYGGYDFLIFCNKVFFDVSFDDYNKNTYKNGKKTITIDELNNTAHINIPILFTNTVDDMGEFSIFCEEWEEGAEYTEDDVVLYDDRVWLKTKTR